jgi:hypothetical protein
MNAAARDGDAWLRSGGPPASSGLVFRCGGTVRWAGETPVKDEPAGRRPHPTIELQWTTRNS